MPDADLMPYQDRERVEEAGPGAMQPLGDGDFRVTLISHGKTRDGQRYYRQEALESAANAGLYDQAKMYLNHRDPATDARRGHRDVKDWVATVKPGTVRFNSGALEAVAHVHDKAWRSVLEDETARGAVGISQDATMKYYQREIDGAQTHVVESIEAVHSVDFVPTGNAWGRVMEAYADAVDALGPDAEDANPDAEERMMSGIADVTLDVLEVERPDLVDAITARVRESDAKTTRTFESWGGLSANDVEALISEKLRPARSDGEIDASAWVRELFEDEVIVSQDGEHTRYAFSIVDGEVTLGKGVAVRQVWIPVANVSEAAPEADSAEITEEQEDSMSDEQTVETEEQETAEPVADEQAPQEDAPEVEGEAQEQEAASDDVAERLAALEAENAALREKIARGEMTEAVREAVAAETGLTNASKRRVIEALSAGAILEGDDLTTRIAEACETERAHEVEIAKAIGGRTRVRDLGASSAKPAPQTEDAREAAREEFRNRMRGSGLSDAEIETLANAR